MSLVFNLADNTATFRPYSFGTYLSSNLESVGHILPFKFQ